MSPAGKAVAHHSSTTVRNNHPACQEIIGVGEAVVPLLLRDLEKTRVTGFTHCEGLREPIRFHTPRRATFPRWWKPGWAGREITVINGEPAGSVVLLMKRPLAAAE